MVLFLFCVFFMDWIHTIWGDGEHLNALQMAVRAFLMFFIALLLIRLGGMRIFGKKSSFDTIIVIMLGAVLARGIVGLSEKHIIINNIIKGKPLIIYESGQINWKHMKMSSLTRSDLMESLRLETKKESLKYVDRAYMETNGRISFIMKA